MFSLSQELRQHAQSVAQQMETNSLSLAELTLGTFKGFLVKDGTRELQERIESSAPILGSFTSQGEITYWIVLP